MINIANIQSRTGNSFRITGINNPNEARQLSLLLRAGALIAPIQIVEERTIGPTPRVCRTLNRVWKRVWPVWWCLFCS